MSTSTAPRPRGWNTWDIRHHTAVAHLPSGLRLRLAFDQGPDTAPVEGFTWRHGLADLGRHTVDGRLAEAAVEAGGARLTYRFEAGDDDVTIDVVSGRATLRSVDNQGSATQGTRAPYRLVLIIDTMDGMPRVAAPEPVSRDDTELTLRHIGADGAERAWVVRVSAQVAVSHVGQALHLLVDGASELRFDCRPADIAAPAEVGAAVGRPVEPEPRTSGWLRDSGSALARALPWNTVYAPVWQRVITPASRDFVCREREGFYGSIAVHGWDSLFAGMLAGLLDPAYARGVFAQILDQATPEGFVPNRVSDDRGTTADRSQPPVGALMVLRAYLASGLSGRTRDRALLEACFAPLRRWNAWWPRARRGPHGMLAFGSDPIPGDAHAGTLDASKRESGLDDSPMYDEVAYDPVTHTMDLADVGLSALHAADTEALAEIARRLGDDAAAEDLRAAYESSRAAIDAALFDVDTGLYRNRHADGRFSPHASPTLLYPLLAGVPTPERAAAVADRLLAPDVLGGSPPLVSTARDDPGFSDTYWRGRVWGPIAFLANEGLRRYGLDAHVTAVAEELLAVHAREWTRHHVRENYPATPGDDVNPLAARSDALHPWGNLLCYIALQRLVDVRAEGWRFAHPGRATEIANLRLRDGLLTVRAGRRLEVWLDERPLFLADPAIVIEAVERDEDVVSARLRTAADATAPLAPVLVRAPATRGGSARVVLALSGQRRRRVHTAADVDGMVAVPAPAAGESVEFTIRLAHPSSHAPAPEERNEAQ